MVYTEFCQKCQAKILTIEQMNTTKLCEKCGDRHAKEFTDKYGIDKKEEKND